MKTKVPMPTKSTNPTKCNPRRFNFICNISLFKSDKNCKQKFVKTNKKRYIIALINQCKKNLEGRESSNKYKSL